MIVKREIEGVKYEGVIRGTVDGEINGVIVVHDPDKAGGRRAAFVCPQDKVPEDHVVLARIAVK